MSKYLQTKKGSLESAVLEAVSAAQQAAIAIAKKEKEKKEETVDEAKFSPKEIKMAIGVASDKRYKGGNYTGAVNAIEKIKKGLSDHPQVKAVLKRQNEEKVPCPKCEGEGCDHCDNKGYHMSEAKLEEKPADLLVLQFRSSSDAAKAYKVLTQKVAGQIVPYEDAYDEGDELVIEFPDDADKLMKDMKSKGAPSFKVLEREEYSDFAKKKTEELTAKQKKIDMNKDGKITGDDLAKLRAKGAKKEEVKEEVSLAELAAKHISDMWKESAYGKKKKAEEKDSEGKSKTTMTGKPMSTVEVSPKDKTED